MSESLVPSIHSNEFYKKKYKYYKYKYLQMGGMLSLTSSVEQDNIKKISENVTIFSDGFAFFKGLYKPNSLNFKLSNLPHTIKRESIILLSRSSTENITSLPYELQKENLQLDNVIDRLLGTNVQVILNDKNETVRGKLLSIQDRHLLIQDNDKIRIVNNYVSINGNLTVNYEPTIISQLQSINTLLYLGYLFTDLSWKISYKLVMSENMDSIKLFQARTILTNYTGIDFTNIKLRLITGKPKMDRYIQYETSSKPTAMRASHTEFKQRSSYEVDDIVNIANTGEYFSYEPEKLINLPNKSVRELDLFEYFDIKTLVFYEYHISDIYQKDGFASYGIEFNAPHPLASGNTTIYGEDNGQMLNNFISSESIKQTAKDNLISLTFGNSMHVTGSHKVTVRNEKSKSYNPNSYYTIELALNNKKEHDIIVRMIYPQRVEKIIDIKTEIIKANDPNVQIKYIKKINYIRFDVGPFSGEVNVVAQFKLLAE